MSVLLALLSAGCFGVGMAVQQRSSRSIGFEHAVRLSMIGRLLARPAWVVGISVSGVGFVLQLVALRRGALVVVQPIVTAAIVMCLAVTSWWDRTPLSQRAWAAVASVVLGVALFLGAGASQQAATSSLSGRWLLLGSMTFAAFTLVCVRGARVFQGKVRAFSVGAAAGFGNAFVAVLGRGAAVTLERGLGPLLRSLYPYGLGIAAVITVLLVQAIYQAGFPTLSLPVATVTEGTTSLLLAVSVLHERPVLSGVRGGLAISGFLLALAGLAVLSRSEADAALDRPAAVRSGPA